MKSTAILLASFISLPAIAEVTIPMNLVDKTGTSKLIGSVTASESKYGTVFTPNLKELTPGLHGFHIHENPSCQPKEKNGKLVPALAAGGHYDPYQTKKHGSPWVDDGHLGDLPPLFIDTDGNANQAVLASRITLSDLKGRALMIHSGGDNHSDHPKALGGGGGRVACGVVPS